MNNHLTLLYGQDSEIVDSNSFTELRISTLQEPILVNNEIEIENLNPNEQKDYKSTLSEKEKELYQSKSDSKNSLFSSDIKITYNNELFEEIEKNNLEKISQILNNDISKINEYNIDGLTPLHLSVIKGNTEIVNLLLEKGANPNVLSLSKNQTPLHYSYLNQNHNTNEIIKNLINHGAKENILDINHKKPSDYLNLNLNLNSSNSISNSISNLINKKISILKLNKKDENNIKLNNRKSTRNNLDGKKNIDKNISESNCSDATIINSMSTQRENKSDKISLDGHKRINVDIKDLITPIKYPCLANLKEETQKEEKSSIKDSLQIENNISININSNNYDSAFPLLLENDIKNYNIFQSTTSYNDNIDLTYTTSIIVDQSNKKTTNKKDKNKNITNQNSEDKKYTKCINNTKQKIDYNSEYSDIDEIYKDLIIKKKDSLNKTYKNKSKKIYLNLNSHNKTEKIKKKGLENNNSTIKNLTLIHDINSNSKYSNYMDKTMEEYSPFSTDSQTGKRNLNNQKYNNDITFIENKVVTEFKFDNSVNDDEEEEENNIKNENITTLPNEFINKSNNLKTIDEHINNNYNEIKNWLSSINLENLYNNFINNEVYNINQLVNRMKSCQTRLNISDIESLLKIDKKGYCYRILVKLEIDAGIIDTKITKFMLKDMCRNNGNKTTNNLKISISQDYNCFGCCKINFCNNSRKNDLKFFLLRYGLMDLYQNFYHNGFNSIIFVLLQMYSNNPITEDILENCFHIYNYEKRIMLLKALDDEVKKINYFLNTNEYNDNTNKGLIKYENIFFEEKTENKNIYVNNNQKICNGCFIF